MPLRTLATSALALVASALAVPASGEIGLRDAFDAEQAGRVAPVQEGPAIVQGSGVHEENLRQHYAMTLRDWCANLVDHWDEAVEEVGEPMAKLWGLYMGACQYGFEHNKIQLHQILAVRLDERQTWDVPLRQWWQA